MSIPLRILADENISRKVVTSLREAGYETTWVTEFMPGSNDLEVIAQSIQDQRLILTSDIGLASATLKLEVKHFGTLLLRLADLDQDSVAKLLLSALATRDDWHSSHSVLEKTKLRTRPIAVGA
jgi:predicted nuclease of predicted toxin-antitoxin system